MGIIKDDKDAKPKAEEIWIEVYGNKIKDKKPFIVYYDRDTECYLVTGSVPKKVDGGKPYIIFQEKDGLILAVWHDK